MAETGREIRDTGGHRREVPENLKDELPEHAQHTYIEAYNRAWDQCVDPERRRGNESREEVAHKIAWAAVKNRFEKGPDGKWRPKNN